MKHERNSIMAGAFKRKGDTKWTAWWFEWEGGKRRRKTQIAYSDKAETVRLATAREDEAKKLRDGQIDPALIRLAKHRKRPIAEHLGAYRDYLLSKGSSERHVAATIRIIEATAKACGWQTVADIDASQLASHFNAMRANGTRARTINWHRASLRGFGRWLHLAGRCAVHPLLNVPVLNEQTDRKRVRRALSDDEIRRLLDAARKQPRRFGLDGQDRAMLYRAAVSTGFRIAELTSLTARSFDLDGKTPAVVVEAGYSKRRRRDVQPIRADVADVLRPWLAERPADSRLWGLARRTAEMVKADLRKAKADWIREADFRNRAERRRRRDDAFLAVMDDAGRVADFHALRHTFITRLAKAGVSPKVAQSLARHSTITLTMDRYAHVGLADELAALDALPAVEIEVEQLAATGTDGEGPSAAPALNSPRVSTREGASSRVQLNRRSASKHTLETASDKLISHNPARLCARTRQWAGSDSNRGLTDYESAALGR
jgi:integrase/recombinase XerD